MTLDLFNAFTVTVTPQSVWWKCRLEYSHYYTFILQNAQGQLTQKLVMGSDRNSNSYKLFMVVLVTLKNNEDPFKNESTRVLAIFLAL